jgi:hypothetical protein
MGGFMHKLCLLLFPAFLFAGSVFQWSSPFTLRSTDLGTGSEESTALHSVNPSLTANPNPLNSVTTICLAGVTPDRTSSLKIFTVDGKQVADFSTPLRLGSKNVIWNTSRAPAGLYIAHLSSGQMNKNLKLIVLK